MNKFKFIILLSFLPLLGFAQTKVDVLVKTLDQLSKQSFNNWKVSTTFRPGAIDGAEFSRPDFDDSNWQSLSLNQSIYVDSCWLRKEITLPKFIAGYPVKGKVKFLVSVDDYGYLWINGKTKGRFPWDGEFVLTENAKPGMNFTLLIKAINTGGPLRLIRAEITTDKGLSIQKKIEDFSLSLKVGQKLLSFDTYQTNARLKTDPGIDKSRMSRKEKIRLNQLLQSLAAEVDTNALRSGNINEFLSSMNAVRLKLKPIADYAKRFTLYFDSNAHIDAAWLWRQRETVEICHNTFSSVINLMNIRPEFTYTQSSAAFFEWMEEKYPKLFKQIQKRAREDRWENVGGMWVEPDCNLPDGVSWMHHLLYAQRYFEKHFGKKVSIGWNPDSFGYTWDMPQFFLNSGIDAFVTQKIGWNDTNVFPYRVFWWEAPDGTRILTYFPFSYVDTIKNPYRLVNWLRQFEANTGFTKLMILFGVGDHGGGPSLEMFKRIDHLKSLDIFPRIEYGTAKKYLNWLKNQDLSQLPVWDSELYLEYHRGTFTTQANNKKLNRKSEVLLTNAEKFSAFGSLFGREYNYADLKEAWKIVLFNQFHDILPGSGIREIYFDSNKSYKKADAIGRFELYSSLKKISENINTKKLPEGKPVIIYNPLSWERTDIARIKLPRGDTNPYSVFDINGEEIPSQIIQKGKYRREIIFVADNVPSMGYKTVVLRKQKPSAKNVNLAVSDSSLENKFFRVTIDPDSGWVKSIIDKRNGKEILTGYGNRLQLLEDKPTAWDAWNIGLTGVEYPSRFRKCELVERGPVRVVLRITRDFLKPGVKKMFPTEDFPTSFFTQDIILTDKIDRIDFKTDVDWWENKTMLKVAFPVAVFDTVATYEIPYSFIQRSTTLKRKLDRGKWEVPALRWADISEKDWGVSLLNNSKYGYDIKGNVMRLSLLRSPKWPDPTADRGDHTIEYALYPHTGNWKQSKTVQRGYEFNNPLVTIITGVHKGKLPKSYSFVKLKPENLILTVVKKAEDSPDAWIFQWYDSKGKDTQAVLTLPISPSKVFMSNFLEEEKTPIIPERNVVKVNTGKNKIITIKVYF